MKIYILEHDMTVLLNLQELHRGVFNLSCPHLPFEFMVIIVAWALWEPNGTAFCIHQGRRDDTMHFVFTPQVKTER